MAEKTKKELIEDIEHVIAFLGGVKASAGAQQEKADFPDDVDYHYHKGRREVADGAIKKLEKVLEGAK